MISGKVDKLTVYLYRDENNERVSTERLIATNEMLRKPPKDKGLKDYIKCVRHYSTKEKGYNCRNRLARSVFIKVIKVWLELKAEEMIYQRKSWRFPIKGFLLSVRIRKLLGSADTHLFDRSLIVENTIMISKFRNKYRKRKYLLKVLRGKVLNDKIIDATDSGVNYF